MIRMNEWKKVVVGFCLLAAPLAIAASPAFAIPEYPKDTLADCRQLNAVGAIPLPQAVATVQNCLDTLYAQRSYTVTARAERFSVPACPPNGGSVQCDAMGQADGIIIAVKGTVLIGDSIMMDLNYSLLQRDNKILGWNAKLDFSQANPMKIEPRFAAAGASATELTCSKDAYGDALKISVSGATGVATHYSEKGVIGEQASLDSRYLPDGEQVKGPAGTTTYFAQGFGDGDTEWVYLALPNTMNAGDRVAVIEMLKSDKDATSANPLGISRYTLNCAVSK